MQRRLSTQYFGVCSHQLYSLFCLSSLVVSSGFSALQLFGNECSSILEMLSTPVLQYVAGALGGSLYSAGVGSGGWGGRDGGSRGGGSRRVGRGWNPGGTWFLQRYGVASRNSATADSEQ